MQFHRVKRIIHNRWLSTLPECRLNASEPTGSFKCGRYRPNRIISFQLDFSQHVNRTLQWRTPIWIPEHHFLSRLLAMFHLEKISPVTQWKGSRHPLRRNAVCFRGSSTSHDGKETMLFLGKFTKVKLYTATVHFGKLIPVTPRRKEWKRPHKSPSHCLSPILLFCEIFGCKRRAAQIPTFRANSAWQSRRPFKAAFLLKRHF